MKEAVILAGGFGTRLREVISDIPKPMAPVADRPFLTYLLDKLAAEGYSKVVLSVGYLHKMVSDYFGKSYRELAIEYAIEEEPMGTGGGICLAAEKISAEHFLILNGDTFFDFPYAAIEDFHLKHNFEISLALRYVENASRYGSVVQIDGTIESFNEKTNDVKPGWINGGVYYVNRKFLENWFRKGKFSFEQDLLQKQFGDGKFGGFETEGYFIDIGVPEDFHNANEHFRKL
ncbi:MAG: NTP transferase domain-containing protein [Bacteroidetes bacterium]|nr:NTP transferase domain-containing protein [Bacteroidota bacterium]